MLAGAREKRKDKDFTVLLNKIRTRVIQPHASFFSHLPVVVVVSLSLSLEKINCCSTHRSLSFPPSPTPPSSCKSNCRMNDYGEATSSTVTLVCLFVLSRRWPQRSQSNREAGIEGLARR